MIGTRLGLWVLDREIGRGGMGQVYLAHRDPARAGDPADLPDRAAVKVLAAELAFEAGFLQRFSREIEILRKLDHPNIVHFFTSGVEDGHYYYAMEYVPGRTFEDLLEQQGRLPWPEVLDLALQIAPALKHAHDRGIIHRDLKPSNLLRADADPLHPDQPGLVKLTDFGIASLFASTHLTVTGSIVGTAEYLSPEQAAGKPVTRRSDLYSFGVVLYTLLTGRTPFSGSTLDLLHKHRFAQFDRPARLVPDIPDGLDAVVCQLLEKDPGKRPADGAALAHQLGSLKRKLERKAANLVAAPTAILPAPARSGREGPATLMSRLVRAELERQNRGGPLQQFFNHPWVIVILFVACVGTLGWAFWPPSPESLFRHGAALMARDDPDDWYAAFDKYLDPLDRQFPDHPHRAEVDEFRRRLESHQAERQAERASRTAGPMSEAHWFYLRGVRLRQQGSEKEARRVWEDLARAFGDVPSEGPWVRLARQRLAEPLEQKGIGERQTGPVEEAVRRARELKAQGKEEEAQAILQALKDLYQDDPVGKLAGKDP